MKHIFTRFSFIVLFLNGLLLTGSLVAQNIVTVAGGGSWQKEGGLKTNVEVSPGGMTYAPNGDLYYTDNRYNTIRKISADGIVTTIAGTGIAGYSGDGGSAKQAQLYSPFGIVMDKKGNLFFTDTYNYCVRKITPNGIISTFAGGPRSGLFGRPYGLAIDKDDNLFVADYLQARIRKIDSTGKVSNFAGTGTDGFNGDGVLATNAQISTPIGLYLDQQGNLFFSEYYGYRVRKVNSQGIITTVAGTGVAGFSGDGAAALNATIRFAWNVSGDAAGNIFIADLGNRRIRKVDATGIISTYVGNGLGGYGGDGGPATQARLSQPWALLNDSQGNLLIGDVVANRIRLVDSTGTISTFAGNGMFSFSGDGDKAVNAELNSPNSLAFDKSGNLYIADLLNSVIRKVDKNGIITVFAGNGQRGGAGDGGPAIAASIDLPYGIFIDAKGNMLVADAGTNRVRRISPDGIITTVAGNGTSGFSGDGGLATQAQMNGPYEVLVDSLGAIYINDAFNYRVRKVTPDGIIQTIAGNGVRGYGGDGGFGTDAMLSSVRGMAMDKKGNLLLVDQFNYAIRRLAPSGIISTIAGNGSSLFSPDGTKGTAIGLAFPSGIAIDDAGAIYYGDIVLQMIRKITDSMTLVTLGGNQTTGFSGDGGPALSASLSRPNSLALDADRNVYFTDQYNNRVRKIFNCVLPRPILTPGDTLQKICQDDELILKSSYAANNKWYLNNSLLPNSSATTLTVKQAGSYSVQFRDSLSGCAALGSNTVRVIVNSKPDAGLTIQGATTFCEGGTVSLVAKNDTGVIYQWWKNGQGLTNAQGNSYFASVGGAYKLTVTNMLTGCAANSNSVAVVVNPIPPKPMISFNGTQLVSSISMGNQWFLNGAMITGATAQQLTPAQSGDYSVTVTMNGCTSLFSEKYVFMPTAVTNLLGGEWLRVGPNPVKDKLYLDYRLQSSPMLYGSIYSIDGHCLMKKSIIQSGSSLNTDRFGQGVYWLKLETSNGKRQFVVKFTKSGY